MLRKALLLLGLTLTVTVPASAQTVDEILQRHIQARGGLENLKSVKSIRYSGKITAGGMDVPITVEQKRPNNLRVVFIQQGVQGIQAYDGTTGWTIPPSKDQRNPEPMSSDALRATVEQADFDGPLMDYKEKGITIAFVDRQLVQGKAAFKLKLTLNSGDVSYVYVDADSYLILREDVRRIVEGAQTEGTTEYGDYRRVGNLMIAHSIQTVSRGSAPSEKITIDKVELNPILDDSIFRMPQSR
jgi:outer membrane lipoprotein-sorting protein